MDMFMTACGAWSFERHLMASGRDSQEQSQHPGDDSVERQRYLFPWKHNLSLELIKLSLPYFNTFCYLK